MDERNFRDYWQSDFSNGVEHRLTDLLKDEVIQGQLFFDGTYEVQIPSQNTNVVISPQMSVNGVAPVGVDAGSNMTFTTERSNSVLLTATVITTGAREERIAFWFRKNGIKLPSSKGIIRISTPGAADTRQCIIQTLQDAEEGDVFDIVCQNQTADKDFNITNLTAIIKS